MDRFSISLEGYHELTQVDKSLPRTHLVETCTKLMDSQWDIKRTPGTAQGAELPLKLLLEKEIRQHVGGSSTYVACLEPLLSMFTLTVNAKCDRAKASTERNRVALRARFKFARNYNKSEKM